jgi:D-aminopeptidase
MTLCMMRATLWLVFLLVPTLSPVGRATAQEVRQSARDLGIVVGVLPPGPLNAITDVAGVLVGQVTITRGDSINTGVTAILPHGGNVFQQKVPAAVVVGNGFGKLAGFTQVQELGELESPVVLTCTLCVPRVADAVLTYLLGLPGNENVRSANPVVGETNDGALNDIRQRPVTERDVLEALRWAKGGPVEQGSVGAGRGTQACGWKGRDRNVEPTPPWRVGWMDRGCPRADELRRCIVDSGGARGSGVGSPLPGEPVWRWETRFPWGR